MNKTLKELIAFFVATCITTGLLYVIDSGIDVGVFILTIYGIVIALIQHGIMLFFVLKSHKKSLYFLIFVIDILSIIALTISINNATGELGGLIEYVLMFSLSVAIVYNALLFYFHIKDRTI